MGNTQSAKTEQQTLDKTIDYVASNYILTQNFTDMKKLSDIKYCDKLVVLTSKIISKNLNNLEIKYLAQRIKAGVPVNLMDKDNILYFNKEKISDFDIKNATNKRRMCVAIAKFYVKIAHIFAAIVTTINPMWSYKNSLGETKLVSLLDKKDVPEGVKLSRVPAINICNKRLNSLLNNNDYNIDPNEEIYIKPNVCNMNYDKKTNKTMNLSNEPGIPELKFLYYDKYDYDMGKYTGMSKEMKQKYQNDVETFYKVFTGNREIPVDSDGKKTIRQFSQIPLRDFHNSDACKKDSPYNKSYKGNLKMRLFSEYANHTKNMMNNTKLNQDTLLKIIDKLFAFNVNPVTKKKEVVISPLLNENSLQNIVDETRDIIINLYTTCEKDFLKGLEIFEAIVEKQILDTSKQQIKTLEDDVSKSIAEGSPIPKKKIKSQDTKKPIVEAAVVEAPVMETPVVEAPVMETPVMEIPVVEAPVVEAPVVEAPVAEAPIMEDTIMEEPITEKSVREDTIMEEPTIQKPVFQLKSPIPITQRPTM